MAGGQSLRQIAAGLGRAPSTACRELGRHGGRTGYRAATPDAAAWQLARRPKVCKLAAVPRLRTLVAAQVRHLCIPAGGVLKLAQGRRVHRGHQPRERGDEGPFAKIGGLPELASRAPGRGAGKNYNRGFRER